MFRTKRLTLQFVDVMFLVYNLNNYRGVMEPVEALMKAGATVNAENVAKSSPLHKAANDGHLSIVQKLIAKGVDVNQQDGKGNTALHIACMNRFQLMAEWLIEHGANVKLKNKSSKLPSALCGPTIAAHLFPSESKQEE